MDNDEIESAITKLETIFEEKDNMTGLDICESARISLNVKGALSENQMSWLRRNLRIHKVDVDNGEKPAREINEILAEIHVQLAKLEKAVRKQSDV